MRMCSRDSSTLKRRARTVGLSEGTGRRKRAKGRTEGQRKQGKGQDWFMKIIIQMLTNMLITMMIIIEGRSLVGGNDMMTGCIRVP